MLAEELARRGPTNSGRWWSSGRIHKKAARTILSSLRSGGIASVKKTIESCLTGRKGVTVYGFSKDGLSKGLSYPIKRKALDQAIKVSGTDEIRHVYYSRKPFEYPKHHHRWKDTLSEEGFRPGECLLEASFNIWDAVVDVSIHVYGMPSSEIKCLKPHLKKKALPALTEWLKMAKSADIEWRSKGHELRIGWHLGEMLIDKK